MCSRVCAGRPSSDGYATRKHDWRRGMARRRAHGDGSDAPLTVPSPEADGLVQLARRGDVDAFASLYRATLPLVFRNLYGRTGDRTLAEDLCSDAYMRAIPSVDRFAGGSQDFLAW